MKKNYLLFIILFLNVTSNVSSQVLLCIQSLNDAVKRGQEGVSKTIDFMEENILLKDIILLNEKILDNPQALKQLSETKGTLVLKTENITQADFFLIKILVILNLKQLFLIILMK